MKLVELQKLADKGYADGEGLTDYFDPETGQPTKWHTGDSLAWFMAVEIAETFEENMDDDMQIYTAVRRLENGIRDLQGAINSLNYGR